jgi:hypothetical protein
LSFLSALPYPSAHPDSFHPATHLSLSLLLPLPFSFIHRRREQPVAADGQAAPGGARAGPRLRGSGSHGTEARREWAQAAVQACWRGSWRGRRGLWRQRPSRGSQFGAERSRRPGQAGVGRVVRGAERRTAQAQGRRSRTAQAAGTWGWRAQHRRSEEAGLRRRRGQRLVRAVAGAMERLGCRALASTGRESARGATWLGWCAER